jgi:transcriptional regulator GlxA family with amidase domain
MNDGRKPHSAESPNQPSADSRPRFVVPDDHTAILARHGVLRGHVVTAVGVLRNRLAEPWTLAALAKEVHLSRSQLVRSFDAVGPQT